MSCRNSAPCLAFFALTCVLSTAQSIVSLPPSAGVSILKSSLNRRSAVQLRTSEYVVPELIIGGEWTSTIKLTNRGSVPITATDVYFVDNLGNDMLATFQTTAGPVITDNGFSFSLPVGSLLEVTFIGGKDALFGHGIIDFCSTPSGCFTAGVYAEVILRNRNSTRPDFESVFPLERPATTQYMLFDGRAGVTTLLYLVNNNVVTNGATIEVINSSNVSLRTVPLSFSGLESKLLTLHVLAPETNGIQGTLVIRALPSSIPLMTATALRISPSNSFTPLRTFIPAP